MATQWYYKIDDEKYGPVSSRELKKLAMAGDLSPSDTVRRTTDRRWVLASKVHGLFDAPQKSGQTDEESAEEEDDYLQEDALQDDIPMGRAVDPAEYQDDEEDDYEEEEEAPAPKSKKRSKSGGFDMSFASESEGSKKSDSVSFDFGASSGGHSRGSYRSYGKKSKSSGKAAKAKPAAAKPRKPKPEDNLDPEEKAKRLSKKEQSKKRFMIIAGVAAGVIVLALVVYFVMKSKPEKQEYRSPKEIAANAAAQEAAKDAESKANADAAAASTEAGTTEPEPATSTGGMFSADGPANTAQAGGDNAANPSDSGDTDAGGSKSAPGKGDYTDASANEIKRGAVQLRVVEAVQGTLNDYAHLTSESEEKLLFVKIKITNKSEDNKNLNYPGWGTKRLYQGVSIQDNFGNTYKLKTKLGARIPDRVLAAKQITDDAFDILVFDAPRKNTEYLLLDLPAFLPGETEPYKFKIPDSMLNAKAETEEVPIGEDAVMDGPAKEDDAKEGDKKEEAKEGDKKAAPNEEGETIDLDEGDENADGKAPASAAPVTETKDNAEAKPEEKAEEAKPAEAKEEKAEEGEKMAPADEEFAEDPEAKAKVAAQEKAVADLSKVGMDTFNRRQLSELARKKIIKINRKDKTIEVLNEKELLKYMKKNDIDVPATEAAAPPADQPAEAGGKERPLSEAELEEKEAREAAEADFGELKDDGDGDAGGEIKEAGAMKELSKQADRENDAAAREVMKGGSRRNNRR